MFPAGPATPRGIASTGLLGEVVRRAAALGWRSPASIVTIVAARPRLAPTCRRCAPGSPSCSASAAAVNVKASTGNLDGLEGAGRAISRAAAVATVRRVDAPMTVRLQDTLHGETRPLEPLEPGHVRIYSCGPTVYGPAHIGNFRSFLFADLLVRHLRRRGLRVTWVMNITDIDDKIIKGAAAAGSTIGELPTAGSRVFLADAERLRMTRPTSCRGPPTHPTRSWP